MKINVQHWDSMTVPQKRAFLRRRREARQYKADEALLERMVQPIRDRISELQHCKHTATIDKVVDPTEIDDRAIEGGVETRCVECKRLVRVS